MTHHFKPPARARGLQTVRADSGGVAAMIEQVNRTFAEFRTTQEEQMRGIAARFDDYVTAEKLDRINADIGNMQAAVDAANAAIQSVVERANAGHQRTFDDPVYADLYNRWFRNGDGEGDVRAASTQGIRAAMSVGTDTAGGFLAPTEWDRTIQDRLVIVSPWRQIARVQQVSVNGFSRVYNNRGTVSGWVGETASRPETGTPTFGTVSFNMSEVYANPAISQTLLDDALVDVEMWLAEEVETEFALQEGVGFTTGDAATRPRGLLTYAAGASNAALHPWGAIGEVNSGAAAALTHDGIVNLTYELPSEYGANAQFIMNRNTHGEVRKLKDGDGRSLWQPSLQAGTPATLMGYPITEIAAMPDLAANALPICFGDFQRGYLIVDRLGLRLLRDPYTNKPNVMFYATKRVAGGVNDPDAMKFQRIAA